jgi:hypothetical protein
MRSSSIPKNSIIERSGADNSTKPAGTEGSRLSSVNSRFCRLFALGRLRLAAWLEAVCRRTTPAQSRRSVPALHSSESSKPRPAAAGSSRSFAATRRNRIAHHGSVRSGVHSSLASRYRPAPRGSKSNSARILERQKMLQTGQVLFRHLSVDFAFVLPFKDSERGG